MFIWNPLLQVIIYLMSTEMNESCTLSICPFVRGLHFQFYKNISRDKCDVTDLGLDQAEIF